MRDPRALRAFLGTVLTVALVAAACNGAEPETDQREGPTIEIGSFDFAESEILAEIYGQALEADGYPVSKRLNLGPREIIFPSLDTGELDLLPEYVGSSLSVGFGIDAPSDVEEGHGLLTEAFAERDVTVLDHAPGENTNVYVVTAEYAEEHDLTTLSDLADVDDTIRFGAAPECEDRDTCLRGLEQVYELDNLAFEPMGELATRISALEAGEIELVALFSTQPVITEQGWVPLDDDRGITPAENIVPVVRDEVLDAYDDELASFLNAITAEITTDDLLELNGAVELEAEDPADVAREWLEEEGFLE